MMYRSVLILVLASVAGLVSCTSPEDGPWIDDGRSDSNGELPEVAGVYGLHVTSEVVTAEILYDGNLSAETTTFITEIIGLVNLEHSGTDLSLSFQPCRAILPQIDDRQPVIDDTLFTTMTPIDISGILFVNEASELSLTTEPAVMTLGLNLDDPFVDPMPEGENDRCVWDQDGDEEPGITVDVSGWNIYIAIRSIFHLTGALGDDGRFTGECDLTLDSQIYEDNIPFFDARTAAEESAEGSEVLSQEDLFLLAPLENAPSAAACEYLFSSDAFE